MSDIDWRLGAPISGGSSFVESSLDLLSVEPGDPFAHFSFGSYIETSDASLGSVTIDVEPAVPVGDRLVATTEVVRVLLGYVNEVLRYVLTGQAAEAGEAGDSNHASQQ